MKKFTQSIIPAIVWLIISTILLTLPGSKFSNEGWLGEFLDKIWFDKWVHIGMFAILTWLWCMGIRQKTMKRFYSIAILSLFYGIIMEFVQQNWTSSRSFDVGDIAADGVGSLSGLIFSIKRYIKK